MMPSGSSSCPSEIVGARCVSKSLKLRLFGLPFDNMSCSEMLAEVEQALVDRRPRMICTANVHLLVTAQSDAALRDIFERCDLLPVDGRGIFYASYILGHPFKEMVGAPSLFLKMLEMADQRRLRVFFLGASPENLKKAIATVQQRYPGIVIAGHHDGYFTKANEAAVVAQIREAYADMLFLGMSSPRKEQFADTYKSELNVPASLGVGGMFDVLAGVVKLAPNWMRILGLEWSYRLMQEPRRLWRRYATTNLAFLRMIVGEVFRGVRCG